MFFDQATYRLISLVSFWLFFLAGLGFVIMEILKGAGYSVETINALEGALDTPFVFVALVYGLSNMLASESAEMKTLSKMICIISGLAFLVYLYVTFLMPNVA